MMVTTIAKNAGRPLPAAAPAPLTRRHIGIVGTGSYLPDRAVSNDEVGAPAGVDDAWITHKTGISSRRRAAPLEATSDLAVAAGRRALERAALTAGDLDLIVVATSTPDHPQPPTATIVQAALGAGRAVAFDLNAVCSGFVFALTTAERFLAAGARGRALVIGADVYSRILDPADRRTSVLFGDGAGAVIIGDVPDGHGVLADHLVSNGDYADLIGVPGGGSRAPLTAEALAAGTQYFTMQGRAVRDFVSANVPAMAQRFLRDAGVRPGDVDHVVPHQANGRMLDELGADLGLPSAVVHRTVERFGNTGAASVPITLDAAARRGALRGGDLVLLIAFGGGMAVGMSLVRW
jgi:3-oxoacyl-(acyl-carrier-protein) synthase III